MQRISFKNFIPGIAWFFVVLFLMCLPGEDIPPTDWLHINFLDKWLHICVFGFLGLLFCWPFYKSDYSLRYCKNYFIKITLAVSIWGLAIEFIQKFFIPGRSFDLLDWAADTAGAILALLVSNYILIKRTNSAINKKDTF